MRRWRLAGALWLCLACAGGEGPPAPGGNLLVLVADDLDWQRLRAYGAGPDAPPTPSLEALAARGVLFRNAYAPTSCSPSRAAMLTGRHSRRHGLGSVLDVERDPIELDLSEWTLPEMLADSALAYDNAAVGKWHLAGYDAPSGLRHPLASGFRWYAGSPGNLRSRHGEPEEDERLGYHLWEKNTNGELAFTERYATSDTVDDAIERLGSLREPWLLWVGFNAVHIPFQPPPEALHTRTDLSTRAARADAMLEALDRELGRLLDALSPELRRRTTVILVGDNGPPLFRLERPSAAERELDPLLRRARARAKGTLYEAGIHVPLIVAGPHVAAPGRESEALVHVVDLFATAAEIAGVDPSELPRPIDGRSLLPLLRDPGQPPVRRFVYEEQVGPPGGPPYQMDRRAVRDERYKLIDYASDGWQELYDLEGGREEQENLLPDPSPEQREALERLRAELARQVARMEREG